MNSKSTNRAMNTLDAAPKAKAGAKAIKQVVKDKGKVTGYMLSDNSVVSKDAAIQMARDGNIKNVGISHRNSTEYLKGLPDAKSTNNLSELPTVSQSKIESEMN